YVVDRRTNTLIAFGALDNLIKGAAGQAVQNMNIRFNFPETSGLEAPGAFPI
ncbi:MAG: N-acetyl-gamma-glutamyl-phosphate reductase, partial [Sphaerochaetaceae bacterium]|nr:N-acetyl-gamma-glutamyl-phosphate reductase [Sphaerochaetaceae bacterium]